MDIIKTIKRKYTVKIKYKKHMDNMAEYDDNDKTIFVNTKYKNNPDILIPLLFHELGHKHCFENNLFYHYHMETDLRLFRLTALKAERFVDRWAKKEMKKYNLGIEYPMFYYDKDRTKYFKSIVNQMEI